MKRKNKKRNTKQSLMIILLTILLVIIFVLLPVSAIIVYNKIFSERYETAEYLRFSSQEFPQLLMEECSFLSNKGQRLAAYAYSKDNIEQPRAVLVLAHGLGGGGHNSYMDLADYFTSNNYLVFAFDATGNDKSEGDSVQGLPQAVIDLDYALRFVKASEKYKDLPIVLLGHSWGGYAVGSILEFHEDVKAAVLIAAFDNSMEAYAQHGSTYLGSANKLFMPYISLYEKISFGKYARASAMRGFAASDAGVMIIQSHDDTMVWPENGIEKFQKYYAENPRFTFIEYEDRGHNYTYYSEAAKSYREKLNKDYKTYVQERGGMFSEDIKAEFMNKYLDKNKCFDLDDKLMQRIVNFFDYYSR